MKTTAKLYVYKNQRAYEKSTDIEVKTYDSTGAAYHCPDILLDIVEAEVEFTMPEEHEILNRAVANLKAEKAKIEADAYIQAKAIQDKIDSLLCIEHKHEVGA